MQAQDDKRVSRCYFLFRLSIRCLLGYWSTLCSFFVMLGISFYSGIISCTSWGGSTTFFILHGPISVIIGMEACIVQ